MYERELVGTSKRSFITLMIISISGTCSFYTVLLFMVSPMMYMLLHIGSNYNSISNEETLNVCLDYRLIILFIGASSVDLPL